MVTKAHTYLKLQVCLSMYDLLLLPGVKGLWRFPASYKFLDNFIEIWIKFTLKKSEKGSPIPRYFQGSCIYVLRIAFECLQHWLSPISYNLQLTYPWRAPTGSTYLLLLCCPNQSIYFYKLCISVPYPNQTYDKQRKKTFLSGFLWNISFPGRHFQDLYGLQQKILVSNHGGNLW